MPGLRNLSGDDLIVVTGGAGFIGSNIVLRLADAGARVVVCDLFRSGEKWRNIATAWIHDVVRPSDLPQWLDRHRDKVAAIEREQDPSRAAARSSPAWSRARKPATPPQLPALQRGGNTNFESAD